MTRAPALLGAAVALALSGAACTKTQVTTPGVRLRQPTSLAVFRGVTVGNPNAVRPYVAIASQYSNDVSIVDAVTDAAVPAPLKLRTLVIPVEARPTLVAAASLGDDPAVGAAKADALVAVAGGGTVLQLVETWNEANLVHSDDALAVDLGYDVLALAAVPSPVGTARFAAVLADRRVAVVTYARQDDGSVAPAATDPKVVSDPLPFQPEAIVAMPGDPGQTSLFVATRDPIPDPTTGRPPVYGVAEISLAGLVPVRALGARGPTRLVAAARLAERITGDDGAGNPLPGSAANDDAAFAGKTPVPRVYAVLDESGCGPGKPIDCGIVALDADPTVASGSQAIPADDPFMRYRAPMRVPARPLAIAASGPPARPPPDVDGEPKWSTLPAAYMRLHSAGVARATTGVAAVACDDGLVYFLDLGRFETATASLAVASKPVSAAAPEYARPPGCTKSTDTQRPECARRRLWLRTGPDASFIESALGVSDVVTMTPGWTPDQQWSLVYQGLISTGLYGRAAEAGLDAGGNVWVALQTSAGGGVFNQVARVWDPSLGVREGDLLVVKARAVGCTGTPTGSGGDAGNEFYVQVAALVPPDAASHPGGAVTVARVATGEDPAWADCYTALVQRTREAAGGILTGLVVAFRAGGYVLSGVNTGVAGGVPLNLGYMGRPQPNVAFTLAYEDEDALATACPFEGWDGTLPPPPAALACDAACRLACERLAVVRKVRRFQGISVNCSTNPDAAAVSSCNQVWPGNKFPLVPSPTALAFTFDVQRYTPCTATVTDSCDPTDPNDPAAGSTAFRDLRLTIASKSNVTLRQSSGKGTAPYQANGMVTFDRSAWTTDTVSGYRFLVSYPADFVLDTSPSASDGNPVVVR